jgi:hypothetical protein
MEVAMDRPAEWIDQAGQALLAQIKDAANVSKENIERAMTMAHRVSLELRAAEERVSQLEADIERLESHATRAERWLEVIKKACSHISFELGHPTPRRFTSTQSQGCAYGPTPSPLAVHHGKRVHGPL